MAFPPNLAPEIGPDGIARESPVIAYTEKIILEEQLQVKRYIEENYSKIRDVEKELANLSMEMKLTAGPKKAALEHLRKKIELATERIRAAKLKEEQARKVWEAAAEALKDEEANKEKLCNDLNQLVQESATTQFSRLEELKRRLEALNPNRASTCDLPPDGKQVQQQPLDNKLASNSASANSASPVQATGTAVQQSKATTGNGKDGGNTSNMATSEVDGDMKQKKKPTNFGRGRGNLVLPKGRGTPQSGWTGAGFET
ncbi:uncharacterized protein LOC116249172 [Nymphaea colorata]|nr:uncharacterized protein LOC116249172 [Nymphaea colorata]